MKDFNIKDVALNAMLGASYIGLVYAFNFMSFEAIQFRVAEALLVLVLFNPKLAYGFVIGTFIANWIGPFGILDGVVGASASLIAIVCMIFTRKKPLLSLIFPAIANAVIVGLMIYLMGDLKGLNVYFGIAFWVFLGEMVVMYFLGYPLYLIINKREDLQELIL